MADNEPVRPNLARVMAAITDHDETWWDRNLPFDVRCLIVSNSRVTIHPDDDWCATITHQSPAEAWEALVSRGVIGDESLDARRSFQCERCGGSDRVYDIHKSTLDGLFRYASGSVACGDVVALVAADTVARATDDTQVIGMVTGIASDTTCIVRAVESSTKTCRACDGRKSVDYPATFRDVVALASAWKSILAAEELTRETCARLAPWDVKQCERIVWRVEAIDGASAMEPEGWPLFGNEAHNNHSVDGASWNDRFRQLEDAGEPFAWWRAHVETWSRGDGRMRGVESPHAPVLAILLSGLQLTSIEGGVASLRCPPIGSP